MEKISIFVNLVRKYRCGQVSADEVRISFSQLDSFHDFAHYLSDIDIREKDSDYAAMQEAELDKFLEAVESGDFQKANRITFLGNSDK